MFHLHHFHHLFSYSHHESLAINHSENLQIKRGKSNKVFKIMATEMYNNLAWFSRIFSSNLKLIYWHSCRYETEKNPLATIQHKLKTKDSCKTYFQADFFLRFHYSCWHV